MRVMHFVCLTLLLLTTAVSAVDLTFTGAVKDEWHGFVRHKFSFADTEAFLVQPKLPRADAAWSWCMEFPDAFTERCAAPALLTAGFYHAYLKVGNTFGAPSATQKHAAFHAELVRRGLSARPLLIGLSRGGLYAHRFAAEHPGKVGLIYGDAPVLDFKSWPGGFGAGKGSIKDWESLKQLYGFPDDAAAIAYAGNPVDTLAVLATAKIPLLYVVGDADDVVPLAENVGLVEQRYRELGGQVEVIHKPDVKHHPHGLDDPQRIVDYVLKWMK